MFLLLLLRKLVRVLVLLGATGQLLLRLLHQLNLTVVRGEIIAAVRGAAVRRDRTDRDGRRDGNRYDNRLRHARKLHTVVGDGGAVRGRGRRMGDVEVTFAARASRLAARQCRLFR
ncbi:hypothetical protein BV898_00649 [Hypsibius exemplaris]|uniref:Uncharacterized protein n=1 Tax=Hypsibius exemplaris TaxID=2072580 RepID=A0A1W0XE23_HYPEX|nr:hypothetical protein BV898_00649 [Hypsibius exemplaris]